MNFKTDIEPILTSVMRHALTTAAGALATAGAIQPNQTTQFVTICSAIAVWAVAQGWSWWQKHTQKIAVVEALATNPLDLKTGE